MSAKSELSQSTAHLPYAAHLAELIPQEILTQSTLIGNLDKAFLEHVINIKGTGVTIAGSDVQSKAFAFVFVVVGSIHRRAQEMAEWVEHLPLNPEKLNLKLKAV